MQIQVKTFRRVIRTRATIYNKPILVTWEQGRGYTYSLRAPVLEFLRLWHAGALTPEPSRDQPDLWEDHRRLV